jgi:GR25 family glycosyltransferase involved in LPS biosynthesis
MKIKIPTYVINLKHRKDRYYHIINEITKLELSQAQIVDAIQHFNPAMGCFESHLKCIRLAKENELPYVLILEDDAIFTDNVVDILNNAFTEVQTFEWDMFFLGANLQTRATRISDTLLKLNGAYAAHAYFVHERFYDTILNLPKTCEIDVHYYNLMSNHNVYMCDPMIAYQLPSYSDLQNGHRDYNQSILNNYNRFKP